MLQLEPMALDGRHGSHISVLACIYAGAHRRAFCMCAYCNVACAQCGGWVPYTRRRRVYTRVRGDYANGPTGTYAGILAAASQSVSPFILFPPKLGQTSEKSFHSLEATPPAGEVLRQAASASFSRDFAGRKSAQQSTLQQQSQSYAIIHCPPEPCYTRPPSERENLGWGCLYNPAWAVTVFRVSRPQSSSPWLRPWAVGAPNFRTFRRLQS